MREFHLGDILSVTTGKLLSPRHMEGIYDILAYMASEPVWTHHLGRVAQEAKPVILAQHPILAEIDPGEGDITDWEGWLAEQVAQHGETFALAPMTEDQHERINPESETRRDGSS